jgi:hypothetical protein
MLIERDAPGDRDKARELLTEPRASDADSACLSLPTSHL